MLVYVFLDFMQQSFGSAMHFPRKLFRDLGCYLPTKHLKHFFFSGEKIQNTFGRIDRRTDELADRREGEWVSWRTVRCMNGWMGGWMDRWMDRSHGRILEWMNEWMNEWMSTWTAEFNSVFYMGRGLKVNIIIIMQQGIISGFLNTLNYAIAIYGISL